jgi:SSS family solute:Na+ symporter
MSGSAYSPPAACKVARVGGIGVGLYCLCYALAGALIGSAGRVFLPALANADAAFAEIVNTVLPVGLRGLVLAAALAAIMSTASACLLAASTVLLEDVYLRLRGAGNAGSIAQSRVVTLALGVVMTVVSCLMHDVIAALTVAYDLLVGGLLVPVIGAMMWRRGTTAGALASIAVGGTLVVVLLAWAGLDSDLPIYAGLGRQPAGIRGFQYCGLSQPGGLR